MGLEMKSSRVAVLAVAVIAGVTLTFFQNCGGAKFKSGSSSASSNLPHDQIPHGTSFSVFNAQNNLLAESLPLAVNTAYRLRTATDAGTPVNASWRANSGVAGFANCAVTGTAMLERTLNCSSVGTAHVEVDFAFGDGTSLTETFERPVTNNGVTLPPSNIVTFSIPAGTGNKPWNTAANPVVVFRGQILRITNNDSMVHRLHTGGRPCPHQPGNISTGQSFDCVASQTHAATATDTYDHNVGNSANFYVSVIDGAALYSTTKFTIQGMARGCVDCHGALATSAKKNATFAMVRGAITANTGGMGAITLSDDQIRAIVYELSK